MAIFRTFRTHRMRPSRAPLITEAGGTQPARRTLNSSNGDFSSYSDNSPTPVTSPTYVNGKGEKKGGWLLGSTRAKEQGRDGDGDGDGNITIATGSPPLPSISGSPSHEADESAAPLNELAARRAQMEVVRSAAAAYHPGLCVPIIEPSRPRSTAATAVEYSSAAGLSGGSTKPSSASNSSAAASKLSSSPSQFLDVVSIR